MNSLRTTAGAVDGGSSFTEGDGDAASGAAGGSGYEGDPAEQESAREFL